MSYPASAKTLDNWMADIDTTASNLKSSAQRLFDRSNAGTADMELIRRFFDELVKANLLFVAAAAVTGLADYARDQKGNESLDPVAEFNAMAAQVVAVLNWIRINAPTGTFAGNTYYQAFVFPAGNVTLSSVLTFTAAQTSGLRTQLTNLMATIG